MSQSVSQPSAPSAPELPAAPAVKDSARWWFAVNAVVAWTGVALQAWLTIANVYPASGGRPGEIDYHNADGLLGTLGHTFDFFTFFTNWANIVVAVVMTLLALDPHRDSFWLRATRLTGLLMITVTALVYAVLLGPGAVNVGWQVPMNTLMHQVTPALTLIVWLVVGPRGWTRWRYVPAALVIPVAWIVWMLVRGAVIDGYPYGIVNVHDHGYATVLTNVGGILVASVAICAVYAGIDWLLTRWRLSRA